MLFFTSAFVNAQQKADEFFKLKWKTEIGKTNFRTNIIYQNRYIVVSSIGNSSASLYDEKDGVYIIDPGTGKTVKHIRPEKVGDTDVNGVAADDNAIYFGTDNGNFYCYDFGGKQLWKYETNSGNDIENTPALMNVKGQAHQNVAFTIEGKGLTVLDTKTGKEVWSYEYYSDDGSFMNAPAIYDVNSDGTDDVIFGAKQDPSGEDDIYGNRVVVLNGKNGNPIWQRVTYSGIHASPLVLKYKNKTEILVTESYSDLNFFDLEGNLVRRLDVSDPDGGISGLFSTPAVSKNASIMVGTAWWGKNDGIWLLPKVNLKVANEDAVREGKSEEFTKTGRVSASPVIGDILGLRKPQFSICTEGGKMLIFSENGKLLQQLSLPSGVEATMLIKNIDRDKYNEILVSGLDGFLYCFKSKAKRGKIEWGQFRGNNRNTGVVNLVF